MTGPKWALRVAAVGVLLLGCGLSLMMTTAVAFIVATVAAISPIQSDPPTDKAFTELVEKDGRAMGCFPRDYWPVGDYRVVMFVCNAPEAPEIVIYRSVKGAWVGRHAIYPDFENQNEI